MIQLLFRGSPGIPDVHKAPQQPGGIAHTIGLPRTEVVQVVQKVGHSFAHHAPDQGIRHSSK